MAQYQPGQRWISDSEAELGLGTILAEDGRLLTVLYPATGETRQYATRNAPLTRVRFAPGDEITHFEGWKLTVQEVEDVRFSVSGREFSYSCNVLTKEGCANVVFSAVY